MEDFVLGFSIEPKVPLRGFWVIGGYIMEPYSYLLTNRM
jgi:hypothetical protein